MSTINLQQSFHERQAPIYNAGVSTFDPVRFAEWLRAAYANSKFKSHAALAAAARLSRSTVSGYIAVKPNSGGKPSQPEAETVIQLAKALDSDVDRALLAAGWAPLSRSDEFEEVDYGAAKLALNKREYTPEERAELEEEFAFTLEKLRRKKERRDQQSR